MLGIHEGPEQGWTSPVTLVALVIGVAAAVGFVVWEQRHPRPLLDVRVFRNRTLGTGSLGLVALFAVMFGLFLVVVQYLQVVLGWSALKAAAGLLPIALVMMPLSAVAPRISQRFGYRNTLATGAFLTAAGLATMALMTGNGATYGNIVPGLLVVAIGVGLAMSPSTTAITESLPADKQGVASALNDTVREFGSALGIALIGSVLQAGYASNVAGATGDLPPELAHQVEEGIGSAAQVAPELGDQAVPVLAAAKDAFVDGWIGAMWISVVIAVAAGAFVLARGPKKADETTVVETTGDRRRTRADARRSIRRRVVGRCRPCRASRVTRVGSRCRPGEWCASDRGRPATCGSRVPSSGCGGGSGVGHSRARWVRRRAPVARGRSDSSWWAPRSRGRYIVGTAAWLPRGRSR